MSFTTLRTISRHSVNIYLGLILLSLACFGLQFPPFSELSAWQLTSIEQGQWWRILTGNFTHTNFAHLGMNLAGLWVIVFLFMPSIKSLFFALIMLSLSVGISIFFTEMTLYVGLSGVLHGLFAYFALLEWLNGRRSSLWLVLGVIAKVAWEQWFGASMMTAELIQARVATEAHLAGTLGGLTLGLIQFLLIKKRRNLSRGAD
ncbi:rhombosortase [Vibrio metschnikovii]|nr:rhombosortase [Vibrio metschnikovii]EKO3687212.1 rhombosortase [Vibrio metschnikovii]EKO3690642.1 rhombosortase [Vibrio metschnikovii]EKO3781022.1 rhombosortase [Vibrio metschnikovii]EKO3887918.1 rhombosortase [Vibrio metschnikovii]